MKIVLISGMSGAGKTSICQNLINRYDDKFHFVNSYTDRPRRDKQEWGHEFVSSSMMDIILNCEERLVASTKIDTYRYCSTKDQFSDDKINLYIVDIYGINDTYLAFPDAQIMTILVNKRDIEVDCIREGRDINVPLREDVDFVVDNNGTIESSANLVNTLVNFDFFKKPSGRIKTLKEKIDYIDMQYRFLNDVKNTILSQFWYANEPIYRMICAYIQENVSHDLDIQINITPDSTPDIYDCTCAFNIVAEYDDDLTWGEINKIYEKMSYYAQKFCRDNKYKDISYYLFLSTEWVGEDEYV